MLLFIFSQSKITILCKQIVNRIPELCKIITPALEKYLFTSLFLLLLVVVVAAADAPILLILLYLLLLDAVGSKS